MTLRERFEHSDFHRVFNFKTEEAKGRSVLFFNCGFANIANAAMTGALYTAFLAENGIDIVRVGIISFIPYISWILSIFSPWVMSHFPKRQKLILFNDYFYYICVILATTIMPLFVEDPMAKTIWFGIFLFLGNACNAIIGSGYRAWSLRFIPQGGRDLNTYTAYTNIMSLIFANGAGFIASFAATAMEASGNQYWFIFTLRIVSFIMFMINSSIVYLVPKDVPLPQTEAKCSPIHVVTEPIKYKPFLLTALIPVFWNIATCLNGSTYNYFLLETVNLPMSFMYIASISSMISSLLFSGLFRRLTDRTSPYWVVTCFVLVYTAMEICYVFVGPNTVWLYVILSVLNGPVGIGFSMGFNSLFYLNLPEHGNKDLYGTFWNLVTNIAAFIGSALGTWILSLLEAHGVFNIAGLDFYGSQLLCVVKFCFFIGIFLFLKKFIPLLQKKQTTPEPLL